MEQESREDDAGNVREGDVRKGRAGADASLLLDLVLRHENVGEFLAALAAIAADRCSRPENRRECGITVIRHRRPPLSAASSLPARAMDELQNRHGEGPCLTALKAGRPLLIQDLNQDGRWPGYIPTALASGVGSILAVPLTPKNDAKAVLNVYSDRVHGFSSADVEAATAFAELASRPLALALIATGLREARDDLKEAMRSRTTIDMAIGAIMAQNGCSKDEAFKFLVSASNSRNVKLRDVAAGVVQAVSGEESPPANFDQ